MSARTSPRPKAAATLVMKGKSERVDVAVVVAEASTELKIESNMVGILSRF